MSKEKLTICFVRRGYSPSGGAEAYLKRLARGVVDAGHEARLFTTDDWPASEWTFGELTHVRARSTIAFANEIERIRTNLKDGLFVSLERICRCDVYRAGDGVHLAWLKRREKFDAAWQRFARVFNRKHRDLLRLEQALFDERGAEHVITNSRMVKEEIVDLYNYRRDEIDIVHNGIPLEHFHFDPELRAKTRAELGLTNEHIAILFAGTGWERKGLRFAIDAIEASDNANLRLLIAGRGNARRYHCDRGMLLGEVSDMRPIYAAADIFILPTIYDPFSNASLEAMACGLPVITTRANGFSEVMEDRIHGSIVDLPSDVDGLTNAIEDWCDPTRRNAARPNILKRASQFDIAVNVAQTLAILLRIAATPKE
jgi:UDP-glucose:(heptosyl)LPS alpha-1,3-glucosyltransferase